MLKAYVFLVTAERDDPELSIRIGGKYYPKRQHFADVNVEYNQTLENAEAVANNRLLERFPEKDGWEYRRAYYKTEFTLIEGK